MSIPFAAVILSGGSGTRLWPLSREAYPKQFLSLTGNLSLFQEAIWRILKLIKAEPAISASPPLVVCNESHRFLVVEQFRALPSPHPTIVLEPVGRNTAPALTAAALLAARIQDNLVLAVMPSDHVIKDPEAFCMTMRKAVRLAYEGFIVTLGVVPTRPETGFGYLRAGEPIPGHRGSTIEARILEAFVEKPDLATAEDYLASGHYLWNSGIFVLRADLWLREIAQFRPDILDAVHRAVSLGQQDNDFFRLNAQAFALCPSDSIDYAVMEKITSSGQVAVLPLDAGWSDLGSWEAAWEVSHSDKDGNITSGDVYLNEVRDCLVRSESRLVAALDVENLIIAETADAVLVSSRKSAQAVRKVAEYLKQQNRSEYLDHPKIHRPWGTVEAIGWGEGYQVKRLTILPGAAMATQTHQYRAEHWIVVKGKALVTRGEETFELCENQSTYIPIGVKHRLENPGQSPLQVC
ncbi:MAG: mannose-1-phosphate guanylyltransferase/mannose-6-phosphate isomerase, partial [Methylohalobius sp.]|nr:mannose-1-phosphate guanylyltransferase/mannose-6-phosphate isomerase [Methylohalobius sp.]